MTPVSESVAATRAATDRPYAGRTVLITGGSRGLGREMAIGFASAGADVAVVSRKKEACQALAEELAAAAGVRTSAHGVHVGEWHRLEPLLDEVAESLGEVDVVVNNAGIAPVYPSLEAVSEELFDKVMAVNVKGPFRLLAAAGARMAAGRGGAMLNISSMASGRPTAADLPYAAAKAALNTLTAGFAQAYGPSVRVNTILAGPFATDIAAGWDMAVVDEMARTWPSRRVGDPAEIVGAALYLCGPTASYTTGAMLAVDGGRLAAP